MTRNFLGGSSVVSVVADPDKMFIAGSRVPRAGIYVETETGKKYQLNQGETFPATHNGRVGCFAFLPGLSARRIEERYHAIA